jgi:hypothetical protein
MNTFRKYYQREKHADVENRKQQRDELEETVWSSANNN